MALHTSTIADPSWGMSSRMDRLAGLASEYRCMRVPSEATSTLVDITQVSVPPLLVIS